MFTGNEMSEAMRRVVAAFGEEDGRQWWLTPHPDLEGAKPGDVVQAVLLGKATAAQELALRRILNGPGLRR